MKLIDVVIRIYWRQNCHLHVQAKENISAINTAFIYFLKIQITKGQEK